MDNKNDPCKKIACELQSCLKNHGYQEENCQNLIEKLRKCCIEAYQVNSKSTSATCSGLIFKEESKK